MNRFLKIDLNVIFSIIFSVLFLLPAIAYASPLSIGNVWTYQNTQGAIVKTMTQTVIGEATIFGVPGIAVIEQSIGSDSEIKLSIEVAGTVYNYEGNFSVVPEFVSGPVGTKWSVDEGDGIEQYEITAVEDIQVPAGLFQGCYKVANSKISAADGTVMSYDERWWHPGTGYVKLDMHIGLSDQEQIILIDYKVSQ